MKQTDRRDTGTTSAPASAMGAVNNIPLEYGGGHVGGITSSGKWMVLLAAFLGWMFDGLEMGIFPLVARPALQEMQHAAGVLDENFVQMWMGRITALFLL